jgi:short subunit dehydrogenase-like uncharacterized protein
MTPPHEAPPPERGPSAAHPPARGTTQPSERRYDLVLHGATGFTGRLVAEHLAARLHARSAAPGARALRWALSGRTRSRLEAVRHALPPSPAGGEPDLLVADAADPDSLDRLARSTRLVISTVGPYALHGSDLVAAVVRAGTDYLDLSGEPAWMASQIETHEEGARRSGARIVFSCGFDSVPFDLGVLFAQQEGLRHLGAPVTQVSGRLRGGKGGVSGGTVASLIESIDAARADPAVRKLMGNPFALTPGFRGARQPSSSRTRRDPHTDGWLTPFIMSGINTKTVHRTQFLLGHPSGGAFTYDEMQMTGAGFTGWLRARLLQSGIRALVTLLALHPTRKLLVGRILPRPGAGPDVAPGNRGRYDLLFIGTSESGARIRVSVGAEEDPGYQSTARMLGESALLLLETPSAGGIWTPGALLGTTLIERLTTHGKMRFEVEGVDLPSPGPPPPHTRPL